MAPVLEDTGMPIDDPKIKDRPDTDPKKNPDEPAAPVREPGKKPPVKEPDKKRPEKK